MREKTALLACLTIVTGLVMSKFLITIGMFLLLLSAFISKDLKADFSRLYSNKTALVSFGIFAVVLLSGIYSEDSTRFWGQLRVMLPFLILPLSFGLLPPFSKKQVNAILYFFLVLISAASMWVLVNYLNNFEFYQQHLSLSKAIATPQNDHIRFSLLLSISIFSAGKLIKDRFVFFWKWERFLLMGLAGFLLIMLHLLSVRSGLLAFYAGLSVFAFRMILVKRSWILGSVVLGSIVLVPIIAFYTLPSFNQKYYLMKYNWEQFQAGNIGNLSDTQRLLSYQVALKVAAQNPWIGVGVGDLYREQDKIYKEQYPEQRTMQPHNQFISFYAGTGIIGLLAFLGCFFFPLFYRKAYKSVWLLLFYTIIFTSLLTENTLFISVGAAMHAFFLMLFVNVNDSKNKKSDSSDREEILI